MSLDDYYSKALALYELANEKLLETFNGNDYTTLSIMLIAFWTIVILILLVSFNIYRKVVSKSEESITNDNNKVDDHQHLPNNNHNQHTATTSAAKINNNANNTNNYKDKSLFEEQFQRSKTNELLNEKPTESLLESSENKFISWMNNAVEWFNESTNNETFVNEMTRNWIDSLNDKSRKLILEVKN